MKTDERIALQGFDISDRTAAVIGCGGLGCHIATHLACAGIGRLILCDFDRVSESNLNRQFLYTADDIGKPKVSLAKNRIKKVSPWTEIETVEVRLKKAGELDFCASADVVFCAVDNNPARELIQEYCREEKKPLVNGGVNGFCGSAYLWLPGKTPDLREAGLLEKENKAPRSISTTVGLIAALEAQLAVGLLLGRAENAGKLHVLTDTEIQIIELRKKEE